jgi:hypothetical protein
LHRDILAERDQVGLVILPYQFPRGRDEVGTVVMVHFPILDLISRGSEEEKGICLFRNIEDKRLVFLGILEKERGGCFRPDHKIWFFLCRFERKPFIDL